MSDYLLMHNDFICGSCAADFANEFPHEAIEHAGNACKRDDELAPVDEMMEDRIGNHNLIRSVGESDEASNDGGSLRAYASNVNQSPPAKAGLSPNIAPSPLIRRRNLTAILAACSDSLVRFVPISFGMAPWPPPSIGISVLIKCLVNSALLAIKTLTRGHITHLRAAAESSRQKR